MDSHGGAAVRIRSHEQRTERTGTGRAWNVAAQYANCPTGSNPGERAPRHTAEDATRVYCYTSTHIQRSERCNGNGIDHATTARPDDQSVGLERHQRRFLWYLVSDAQDAHARTRVSRCRVHLCATSIRR